MKDVKQFVLTRGIIRDNSDPTGDGRVKLYIPSVDSPSYETEDLPWAAYVSPFGGHTANFKAGPEDETIAGITTYGLWAIPKNGAQVLCGFTEGDPLIRFWIGCFYLPEHNHTLPAAISEEGPKTEIDESGAYGQHKIPFQKRNLAEAGLDETFKHYRTRGGWQRSVSYADKRKKTKPTSNGYKEKPTDPKNNDSQIVSLTTPGRHYMAFSDVNDESRMRFKTAMGSQIILDDTNEKIYISTARGRNYVEFDEGSGKIHIYSTSKVNIHSENDINLFSDENINIVAKKRVNIKSQERGIKLQAKMSIENLSEEAQFKVTASRDIVMKTTDGPKAKAVSESQTASPPPYKGKPLGVIRDWAEEAGSSTSAMKVDIVNNIDVRSNEGSIRVTAKGSIDLRAMTADIKVQAAKDIHHKAGTIIKIQSGTSTHIKAGSTMAIGSAGTLDVKTDASLNLQASSSANLKAGSSVNVEASSSLNLKGSTTFVQASGTLNLMAAVQATTFGDTGLYNYDPDQDLPMELVLSKGNASSAAGASSAGSADSADAATAAINGHIVVEEKVVDKMIRPLHETKEWTRDEDEPICKTPRNSKYKG